MSQLHMGINLGHDRSVAVVRDGEIIVAIEQERLDRIKHSVGFMVQSPHILRQIQVPGECIRYCLDTLGVPLSDMATITANMPGHDHGPSILRGKFSRDISGQVRAIPSHHLAHAYSAYWPSGFEDALVLVADGSGSTTRDADGRWRTEATSLYVARGGRLEPLHLDRVEAHLAGLTTLGFVYEHISRKAGFFTDIGDHIRFAEAGKLMGLAAYGGPQPHWTRWLRPVEGVPQVAVSAYDIFLEVAALEKKYDDGQGRPYFRPWLVDLAHKVQQELEDALCHIVSEALEQTGLRHLCMAGGVALNSVANYQILKRCALDDIFIFPAAADNGIAAGCALWAYAEHEGGQARPPLRIATLGRPPAPAEVEQALEEHEDLLIVEHLDDAAMLDAVSAALAQGSIVARFEGGCEYGPRALGHRSILADPTFARMKDIINARVKFREAFRPFAPVIPLERADEVFALGTKSPFMLLVADIRPEFHALLPAITHADGTGRVQTCTQQDNPFFTSLCNALSARRGGPPVLLNTSFNVAGQPIVETPSEAVSTFLRTDIDYLSLGNVWIRRRHQPIKDYAEHEATLVDESLPVGLPPDAPSVLPLMAELDAALFQGQPTLRWSPEELRALSAAGGRFKETSVRFPDDDFIAPLRTTLGPHAVLIVDPLGDTVLADPTQRRPPLRLDRDRLELLLAVQGEPGALREQVRVHLGRSHRELYQLLDALHGDITQFGLEVPPAWRDRSLAADTPLEGPVAQTLAPFADAGFRSDTTLAAFSAALDRHGYTEDGITAALQVDALQSIQPTHLRWHAAHQLPDTPLADLIRLFLLRASLPRERVVTLLGGDVVDRLGALGLLHGPDDAVSAAVDLFCSGGMRFATDHRYMLREGDRLDEDPVMYIGMDSHGLVQTAPRAACDRLLDLCCGSGIQGIVASRYARSVVAIDLNPRAIRFSRFNAQLNGVVDYTVQLGSLYAPVAGERFDVILANPPFVPSPEMGLAFRDGGARGEIILRQIVAGAADHLTPTGRLCIVTDLADVETYAPKLQGWWGENPMEGLILTTADRDEVLFSVPHCHAPFGQTLEAYNAELDRWIANYRSAGLTGVNFGYLLVWRLPEGSAGGVTTRTIHNPAAPIHGEVNGWRTQQHRWGSPEAGQFYVCLHPGARLAHEHGAGEPTHTLTVPDNAFFTTYTLSGRTYDELCHIGRTPPKLGAVHAPEDGWLRQLHRLGILRLEPNITRRQKAAEEEVGSHDIVEQATKTTPTCLSSYLR